MLRVDSYMLDMLIAARKVGNFADGITIKKCNKFIIKDSY